MTEKPGHWYRQSGAIPVREGDGDLEVLLVTSLKSNRWIIPKGIVEPGMSAGESALEEAWEEAGVRGSLRSSPAGSYRYGKWGGTCTVEVFVLDVEEVLDGWPEGDARERKWFPREEAAARVREEELRRIILGIPAA